MLRLLVVAMVFSNTVAAVEVIDATPLAVGGEWNHVFLEGPSAGPGSLVYFANREVHPVPGATANKRGRLPTTTAQFMRCVDISNPAAGVSDVYVGQVGGTWWRDGVLTFVRNLDDDARISQMTVTGSAAGPIRDLASGTIAGHQLVKTNDLVRDRHGGYYFTDWKGRAVGYIAADGTTSIVAAYVDDGDPSNDAPEELDNPNGITLSPDGGIMYVTDSHNVLHARIASPGVLAEPLRHVLPAAGITSAAHRAVVAITPTSDPNPRQAYESRFGRTVRLDGMSVDQDGVIYAA
ncbi:MAG: SMP-30/gluconolactonase/LRE family protein, partial [Planctomycetota bacterium]